MDLAALKKILGEPRSVTPMDLGVRIGDRVVFDLLHPVESERRSAIWTCELLVSEPIDPQTISACCHAVENADGSWILTSVCSLHASVLSPG